MASYWEYQPELNYQQAKIVGGSVRAWQVKSRWRWELRRRNGVTPIAEGTAAHLDEALRKAEIAMIDYKANKPGGEQGKLL